MICFYHKQDLDGHCSGAIVKMKYPECRMVGVDYNNTLDNFEADITTGETIYIVDFCFEKEDMLFLDAEYNLIWIDHHKSSIEMMEDHEDEFDGLREIGKAGCELTWEYCWPDEEMPKAVYLLGRYDVWQHEDDDVLPFQYGVRTLESTLPEEDIWSYIFNNPGFYINKGRIILEYENKQNKFYAKCMSYEVDFNGLRAIVLNKACANSKAFDTIYNPELHDIMILFGYKPPYYKYTLFSDKPEIDVSEIARQYGGGGHKGAAGFYSGFNLVAGI